MARYRLPVATYRLQLHARFTFDDARGILDYLCDLGITDVYTSPIFSARRGSTHGYDVIDARAINPELGGEEAFERFCNALRSRKLGLLVDIVPNHMAASPENSWWMDLLEFGQESQFAEYFDVVWEPIGSFGATRNRLLVPILGKPYGEALEAQELKLAYEAGTFSLHYYDKRLPISPRTYAVIADVILERGAAADDGWCRELAELKSADFWSDVSVAGEAAQRAKRLEEKWDSLYEREPELRTAVDRVVGLFNGSPGEPASFDALDRLLAAQPYRLAYWRMASEEINYRRFFDVTDLVGVRIEDQQVFQARHARLFELIKEEKVTGLRIDHIDGLYDPVAYLRKLQSAIAAEGDRFYVIVEKILAPDEPMPPTFVVSGTTGYDFLCVVNDVLIDRANLTRLGEIYDAFTGRTNDYERIVYTSKKSVIDGLFAGEMRALAAMLARLAAADRSARDYSFPELLQALTEVTASLAVYRTYIRDFHVSSMDEHHLNRALEAAHQRSVRELDGRIFGFLRRVLLLRPPAYVADRREWLDFVQRWQQFTGRAMAKGVEDTAFYVYNRLISMNEVGAEPQHHVDDPVDAFHRWNERQLLEWPHTLNTTSTHDTKRSEDVRARINVLSEIPDTWEARVRKWARMNHALKREVHGAIAPDRNEEFMIYQTLVGIWTADGDRRALQSRLTQFVEKALRESKVNTSWIHVDAEYERAVIDYVVEVLASEEFVNDLAEFVDTVSFYGFLNSLSQATLKIMSPGVPDFYQGTEGWDFSVVDPDNRRDVDYKERRTMLDRVRELSEMNSLYEDGRWNDGAIKMFLICRLLRFRGEHAELLAAGTYQRLQATGDADRHIVAFSRTLGSTTVLTVVPRLLTALVAPSEMPLGEVWKGQRVTLGATLPVSWTNICTQKQVQVESLGAGEQGLSLSKLFDEFPIAVLTATGRED